MLHLQPGDKNKLGRQFFATFCIAAALLLVMCFLLVPRRFCCAPCRHSKLYAWCDRSALGLSKFLITVERDRSL